MTTIDDVAREVRLSTATVSRALRGLPGVSAQNRARITAASRQLGYVPSPTAVALAGGRTGMIAMIVPRLEGWYVAELFRGAEEVLRASGYDLVLHHLAGDPEARRRIMKGASLVKRVDAVVVLGMCPTADEHAGLAEFGRPVITAPATTPGHVGVRIDDVHAARVATSHLLALGHGRIAYAGGPFDTSIAGQSARLAGYRALMREHAILQRCHALTAGAGLEAGSHLLGRRDRPTAILAGADEIAFGVLRAARELGLGVPDDVSVIGIDGHELAGMFGLTTVAQPLREHGRRAARHVLAALTGVLPPEAEELCADLILRSSTARAP